MNIDTFLLITFQQFHIIFKIKIHKLPTMVQNVLNNLIPASFFQNYSPSLSPTPKQTHTHPSLSLCTIAQSHWLFVVVNFKHTKFVPNSKTFCVGVILNQICACCITCEFYFIMKLLKTAGYEKVVLSLTVCKPLTKERKTFLF